MMGLISCTIGVLIWSDGSCLHTDLNATDDEAIATNNYITKYVNVALIEYVSAA